MSGSALASAGPMAGFPRARLADGQWVSTHLFYPGDRNRVLLDFVLPVASRLVGSGAADRFFFIRYYEEGPHVRLRLRIDPDRAGEIEEQIARGADNFFSLWPVARALREPWHEPSNRSRPLVPMDPAHPNLCKETWRPSIFEPETERYGGRDRLPASLDFFALSSAASLRYLAAFGCLPWSKQMPRILRILLRQALGFARNRDELLALADYFSGWRETMGAVIARGDQVFDEQREAFVHLVASEIERWLDPADDDIWSRAASELSTRVGSEDLVARRSIGVSQMHMTANRLGLENADEAYLTRLLTRACESLPSSCSSTWELLPGALHAGAPPSSSDREADLADRLLYLLAEARGARAPTSVSRPDPQDGIRRS